MDSASLLTKIQCPDDRYPTLKISIAELIFNGYEYIPANAMHDLTVTKVNVIPVMRTEVS